MATIPVRNLDDDVYRRLKERAALNGRSLEAEASAVLCGALTADTFMSDWLAMAEEVRGEFEFELPARSLPRDLDLLVDRSAEPHSP